MLTLLKNFLLLIPLLGGVSFADNYTLSTKILDTKLKYNVKDTNRALEAELEFPSKAVAILLGYRECSKICVNRVK